MERYPHDCPAQRIQLIFLVLHVAVNVKGLFVLGRLYPWPRPERCRSCGSKRIWGHGYVPRYFEGFLYPLLVRRLRCPDCGTVYTLRPDAFVRGFRYSLTTIVSSLTGTITGKSPALLNPSRQARQYWLRSLRFQASRTENVLRPDVNTLYALLSRDIIPFTRSFNRAILRL
jgi:hypothetical protein